MPKKMDFLGDESGDEEGKLTINKSFAENYDRYRRKEETQKLKDRYGDVSRLDESESEDSEVSSTDEEELLDINQDKEFLKTLAALKRKDPTIYNEGVKFFSDPVEPANSSSKSDKKKEKPMYLKDYDRKVITERGGELSESSDDDDDRERMEREHSPSYFQKQRSIKESFKQAVQNESDDEDFLRTRVKTKAEKAAEEEDYLEWLKGKKDSLDDQSIANDLGSLREAWNDAKIDPSEKFLKSYLLERKYISCDQDESEIPSYDEIVSQPLPLEEEENEIEKQEEFERKYNFRFEEPDEEFVKSYPRTIKDTLRRENDKRRTAREAVKERKEQEKRQRKQEINELKNLVKSEMNEQIAKLRAISGDASIEFKEEDVGEEFDPEKYDKRMKELFDDKYYSNLNEDEKPQFSPDPLIDKSDSEPDWDEWNPNNDEKEYQDDGEIDESQQPSTSKKLTKSTLAEKIKAKKPIFDPKKKTFAEYLEQYYALEAESVAGPKAIPFKYREVPANNFGLSVEEVLSVPDKELNAWASLKKTSLYRSDREEEIDIRNYEQKGRNLEKKKRILQTTLMEEKPDKSTEVHNELNGDNIASTEVGTEAQAEKKSKRKRKRKSKSSKDELNDESADSPQTTSANDTVGQEEGEDTPTDNSSQKKRKRKSKSSQNGEAQTNEPIKTHQEDNSKTKFKQAKPGANSITSKMSDERLRAYGINPKKFRNKLKYSHE